MARYDFFEFWIIHLLADAFEGIVDAYAGLYHYGKLVAEIEHILSAGPKINAEIFEPCQHIFLLLHLS